MRKFSQIDTFGEYETIAGGIDQGNIVGYYSDMGPHGFMYDGVTWAGFDVPGAIYTYASDIDGDNIVGSYFDGSGWHGFVYTIPEPGTVLLVGLGGLGALRRRRLVKG